VWYQELALDSSYLSLVTLTKMALFVEDGQRGELVEWVDEFGVFLRFAPQKRGRFF